MYTYLPGRFTIRTSNLHIYIDDNEKKIIGKHGILSLRDVEEATRIYTPTATSYATISGVCDLVTCALLGAIFSSHSIASDGS